MADFRMMTTEEVKKTGATPFAVQTHIGTVPMIATFDACDGTVTTSVILDGKGITVIIDTPDGTEGWLSKIDPMNWDMIEDWGENVVDALVHVDPYDPARAGKKGE